MKTTTFYGYWSNGDKRFERSCLGDLPHGLAHGLTKYWWWKDVNSLCIPLVRGVVHGARLEFVFEVEPYLIEY